MRTSVVIFVVIAVALLAACEAKRNLGRRIRHEKRGGPVAPKMSIGDVEQFLIGFGEGLEYDWAANFSQCVAQEQATLSQFETAWQTLKDGFHDKSIDEIAAGLRGFGAGIDQINTVASECGAISLVEDLTKLVAEIQSGHVFEVVIAEAINIFYHGHDLKEDFEGAISSWDVSNYNDAGGYVGKIVGILLRD